MGAHPTDQRELRAVTDEEFAAHQRTTSIAFGLVPGEQKIAFERQSFEADRSLAVFEQGHIVATAGAYGLDLTLPGGTTLPVAGVTAVGVLPTHRRQGLLRQMMRRQLDDVRARGEAVAILTASESAIYGRFGYGLASSVMNVAIDRGHADLARHWDLGGRLALIDREQALAVLPPLYDALRRHRPGAVNRSAARWQQILDETLPPPDGTGPRFHVAYTNATGQVEGAAIYRIRRLWTAGLGDSTLLLNELLASTPEATAALWQFCTSVDLTPHVEAFNRPVDDPLRWLLADPRRLRVTRLVDDLWVRLLDIPTALAARRYTGEGRVVFAVDDPFRPENTGRYLLDAGTEGATCRSTSSEPDLTLGVADLGAAYLGGVRFSTLASAGRIAEHTPGAILRADALFASDPAPWCATAF